MNKKKDKECYGNFDDNNPICYRCKYTCSCAANSIHKYKYTIKTGLRKKILKYLLIGIGLIAVLVVSAIIMMCIILTMLGGVLV